MTAPATARELERLLADLAPIGRDPASGGYRRAAHTDADSTLREWFAGEAHARGLEVHEDRATNLWAWWGDPGPGAVATGSHLDAVADGGAYDGPLGVVSALVAVDELRARGLAPRRPLAVVVFADEEGARFGTPCVGSRVLTGRLDARTALALRDDAGLSLAEVLVRTGRDPGALGPEPELVGRLGAFVELHIEQGRGLVELGRPVGVGTRIRPHGRWRLELEGRADHAGTTRLEDRRDPTIALAHLVLAARRAAEHCGALATVGRLLVEPNGVNAVASRVVAWLDARADDERAVRDVVAAVEEAAGAPAREESWTPGIDFHAGLTARMAACLEGAPGLATGAGHDAGVLAAAGVPAGMLYVRNPSGVSHSPAEHAEPEDRLAGVRALADVLGDLLTGPL